MLTLGIVQAVDQGLLRGVRIWVHFASSQSPFHAPTVEHPR
jgi:hypothetical protein